MADKQPEALRLAEVLPQFGGATCYQAAAELRRLAAIEAERDALRMDVDALRAERDEDRRREYGYSQQTVDAITNEREALRAERDALLSLIADDAFAASFQSLAQYRSALLKSAKGGGNG